MPTFGKYETGQRLFLSGVGGIYVLKSDESRIIKVLHPPVGIWSDERIGEEIDAFRLRAKIQKKLAQSSRFWAPIHDNAAIRESISTATEGGGEGEVAERGGSRIDSVTGETEGRPVASGAFAIMDRYERSLQSLLDGRVTVDNADLRAIFSAVFQGLLDLQKSADRPHGALKPANVLLRNSANLSTATVHLTDPCPDGALTAKSAEKDRADIARLLYHLVNRRPYDEGTIGRNKEWNALGPNGEDWRALCNNLLDPQAPADQRDWEKILPRVATWTRKPRKSKAPLIAAAVMLVLAGGGVAAYYKFRTPPAVWDEAKWENESLAYYGWFAAFADELSKGEYHDRFFAPSGAAGPYALPAIDPKDLNKSTVDPWFIANSRNEEPDMSSASAEGAWENFIANPVDDAKKSPGPSKTADATAQIKRVQDALAAWPVLVQVDQAAQRYQGRQWTAAAARLKEVSDAARPPEIPPPAHDATPQDDIHKRFKDVLELRARNASLAAGMVNAVGAAKAVASIDLHWQAINEQLASLHGGDEIPLLKKLRAFAQNLPNAPAGGGADTQSSGDVLKDLDTSLGRVDKLVKDLNLALNNTREEIVYTELAKDPTAGEDVTPSIPAFEALAKAVPNYFKLKDDPRVKNTADWKAGQTALSSDMDVLAKALAKNKAAGKNVDTIQKQLDDLKARQAALTAALAGDNTVPIVKNSQIIASAAAQSHTAIAKMFDDAKAWSAPFKIDPPTFVKERENEINTSPLAHATPVVRDRWKTAHDTYLAKIKSRQEDLRDYTTAENVLANFQRLERAYQSIEAAIPLPVEGLTPAADAPAWQRVIATHVTTDLRQQVLTDLMNHLPDAVDGAPDVQDKAFVSYKDVAWLPSWKKTVSDTADILAAYSGIAGGLDQLRLQASDAPAGGGWRDLYGRWGGAATPNPLLADPVFAEQLAPLNTRAKALLALDAPAAYSVLLPETQSPAPEIALTAWRKLGSAKIALEDVKTLQAALDNENTSEKAVTDRINGLTALDAARRSGLLAEIAAARPVRWRAWAKLASANDDLATAVATASDWGAAGDLQTDKELSYYQQLMGLRAAYQKGPTDEKNLVDAARNFRQSVQSDPGLSNVAALAAVRSLLDDLDKAIKGGQTNAAAKQGPQWAGWTTQPTPSDQVRIFQSPDGKRTLEFQKMTVTEPDGTSTIMYLCTTDVSVGLFVDVMNERIKAQGGRIDEIDNAKQSSGHWFDVPQKRQDDDYYRKGIRSWSAAGGRFEVNTDWIDVVGPSWPPNLTSAYPANAVPPAPRPDDPVQLLSPWSAMFAAQLLGCRLPTSPEWTEAYHEFEEKDGLPKNVWNLRGSGTDKASWRTQENYATDPAVANRRLLDASIFKANPNDDKFQDQPWTFEGLVKAVPGAAKRLQGAGEYNNNTLWFQPVNQEKIPAGSAGAPALVMHHLVGNVAQFVFDGKDAAKALETFGPSADGVDKALAADKNKVFVIGGSSLSQPDNPFTMPQPVDLSSTRAKSGFSDVGFRLAYTEPQETVAGILHRIFDSGKPFPGPRAK